MIGIKVTFVKASQKQTSSGNSSQWHQTEGLTQNRSGPTVQALAPCRPFAPSLFISHNGQENKARVNRRVLAVAQKFLRRKQMMIQLRQNTRKEHPEGILC